MMGTLFFRLLPYEDKAAALAEAVAAVREGRTLNPVIHAVDPASFRQVPGSPFAYWVSERLRRLFTDLPPFEGEGQTIRVGLQTSDDFRFVRAWWEVAPEKVLGSPGAGVQAMGSESAGQTEEQEQLPEFFRNQTFEGKCWAPFAKGGAYSPYYTDLHLVVNWKQDGEEIKSWVVLNLSDTGTTHWSRRVANSEYYFLPGLTWSSRTTSGISFRNLPAGSVFAHKGPAAFVTERTSWLGLLQSSSFKTLISLQLAAADAAARSYEVGLIQRTPVPSIAGSDGERLGELAQSAIGLKRLLDTANETSHVFVLPALLQVSGSTLAERAAAWNERVIEDRAKIDVLQRAIDEIADRLYGLTEEDRQAIEASPEGGAVAEAEETEEDSNEGEETVSSEATALVTGLVSYAMGITLGRWDIRYATGQYSRPELPDPFAPLPVCSPGMLQGEDGLPQAFAPEGYPSQVNPDGILVDDEGHPDDIIRRVREALEVLWAEHAGAIEEETCEVLGMKGLREYFRRPSLFFDDHIKRYSKSRRKAPIYWCLSTPSQSYAVWLYYHRFSRDTFYKVLNDYVTPKLQHEERKLDSLRAEAGVNPTPSQRNEIADQEAFVEELRVFREEVARIAPLWNPNPNDGVIINFAPLWRLVPQHRAWQQECKAIWDKLVQGEYGWAHLAMHLWPERVVPKCRTDRSLAIAHGLEDAFWEEKDGKWTPKDVSDEEVEALIRKRKSSAVEAALKSLLSASAPVPGRTRGGGGLASRGRKRSSPAPTNNVANSVRRKRGSTGDDE